MKYILFLTEQDGKPVAVNFLNISYIKPDRNGGCLIAWPGGEEDFIKVKESFETLSNLIVNYKEASK